MKILDYVDQHIIEQQLNFLAALILAGVMILFAAGCGEVDESDGTVVNSIALPTDDSIPLNLFCADVGINNEKCILDDPANPYARVSVSEENKFELDGEVPSATAGFYLWATALARGAGAPGENQFYTALNLQRMWAASNSDLTRFQALRAYRSLLDNFFDSATFFEIPLDSGNFFPQNLNIFAGELLFTPTDQANTYTSAGLFSADPKVNKDLAHQALGEWGYFYDENTGLIIKNF